MLLPTKKVEIDREFVVTTYSVLLQSLTWDGTVHYSMFNRKAGSKEMDLTTPQALTENLEYDKKCLAITAE